MIIDIIFSILLSPINAFMDLIPRIDPISDNVSNNLVGVINNVACFVPVGTFFLTLSLWFVLANLDFTISAIHWVVRKIPGVD